MIIRASSLNRLRKCSGYQSCLRGGQVGNKYTRAGNLAHKWLETAITTSATSADLMWPSMIADETQNGKLEISDDLDDLLAIVHTFWEWFELEYQNWLTFPIGVECELEDDVGGAILRGHADAIFAVEDSVLVIDWKLYKDPGSLPDISDDLQMAAYATLAAQTHGFDKAIVVRAFVRQSTANELHLDEQGLERAAERVRATVENTVNNADCCTTGAHCQGCLARWGCIEYVALAKVIVSAFETYAGETLSTNEEALQIVRCLPAAKALVKRADEEVKRWVDEYGRIVDVPSGMNFTKYQQTVNRGGKRTEQTRYGWRRAEQ